MAVFYFPSHITKNNYTYTLRPNQQVIAVPEDEMRRMFTFLMDYSKCGWRVEYSFRIIDQLLENAQENSKVIQEKWRSRSISLAESRETIPKLEF